MRTKHFIYFIITLLLAGSFLFVHQIFAEDQATTGTAHVQYPVEELGSCADKTACKAYCDESQHTQACLDFAGKNNMMSQDEITVAKKFVAGGNKGPGDCKGKNECEIFCNDIANIDECVAFAEKDNMMPPEKLEEAKKVQAAIKRGVKPPPCKGKEACDAYCEDSAHMEECIAFGVEAGFIQGNELENAQKTLAALKKGVKPPPCKGKEACDAYCQNPDNMETCMNFAMEAGFMTEEQKAESQKMLAALKKGIKPPACQGKEDCDAYCGQEEHFDECTNFAEAAGFMTAEQATMARKTKGKGPGDCKGKDECEAYCNNPDNQETCFNFAKENGMIPEEDLKRMEEGKQQFKESLNQAPSEVTDCLNSSFGSETMEKFKSGAAMPPKEMGDQMRQCFEKVMPQPPPGSENGMMPANQPGPGGCKTPEECKAYCESNPDDCKNFAPVPQPVNQESNPSGPGAVMQPTGQPGPGGYKTPEECKAYCESNPEACKNFQPSQSGSGGAPTPGTNPTPCEGTNCPPPPNGQQFQPQNGPQYQMQPDGQTLPERTIQQPGEQTPSMGIPSQPGGFVQPPEGYIAPPPTSGGMPPTSGTYVAPAGTNPPVQQQPYVAPPTTPDAGGGALPGDYVPLAPPSGEITPPPPSEPPPTTSIENEPGSLWHAFLRIIGF